MATITVLGAGVMASALSVPLTDNGHEVRLVGTHLDRAVIEEVVRSGTHTGLELQLPDGVTGHQLDGLAEAIDGTDVVLVGVNSFGVRWAGEQLAGVLPSGVPVIAVTKGVAADDDGGLQVLPDVLADHLPDDVRSSTTVSAIVGPSIAGEVALRRHTGVVFAGPDAETVDRLAELFRTPHYHVWTSADLLGMEVIAALKNAYALGVGIAEGMLERIADDDPPYGNHNHAALLFAQGAVETARMVDVLGGGDGVSQVLALVGDLHVTCTGGRNVRLGRRMGAGMTFEEGREALGDPTLEGAACIEVVGAALPRMTQRGVIGADEFPLMRHLYDVIVEGRPLDLPLDQFFRR